jgi:hypothetical protein
MKRDINQRIAKIGPRALAAIEGTEADTGDSRRRNRPVRVHGGCTSHNHASRKNPKYSITY